MRLNLANSFFPSAFNLPKLNVAMMSSFFKKSASNNNEFSSQPSDASYECEQSLQNVIRHEIIPRLLSSQTTGATRNINKISESLKKITDFEISVFTSFCIEEEARLSQEYVKRLITSGVTTDQIFLDLITPAAHLLGKKWDDDVIDFTQVTLGLVRLHSITHEIGFEYQHGPTEAGEVRRLLIASSPGSQHFLGPNIVANFFRKEGWQVVLEVSTSSNELIHAVENEWFDVIGISVSIKDQLRSVAQLVIDLRKGSRNPNMKVMLGGPIFGIENYEPASFGADAICTDAKTAVEIAKTILAKAA